MCNNYGFFIFGNFSFFLFIILIALDVKVKTYIEYIVQCNLFVHMKLHNTNSFICKLAAICIALWNAIHFIIFFCFVFPFNLWNGITVFSICLFVSFLFNSLTSLVLMSMHNLFVTFCLFIRLLNNIAQRFLAFCFQQNIFISRYFCFFFVPHPSRDSFDNICHAFLFPWYRWYLV